MVISLNAVLPFLEENAMFATEKISILSQNTRSHNGMKAVKDVTF